MIKKDYSNGMQRYRANKNAKDGLKNKFQYNFHNDMQLFIFQCFTK